ncbi:MAG TPA: peptidoglycan recognition family protein, partial [Polyangiaceae bacterium]
SGFALMRASSKTPLFLIGSVLAACSATSAPAPSSTGALSQAFDSSAAAASVPRDLLVAIAQVEGGLKMPAHRTVDPDADAPVAGPLELRHGKFDSLARAAQIAGTTELALRQDTDLALSVSAKVLAELGAQTGASADLASWQSAIETMSGYADSAHREEYAHRVFAVLSRGGTFPARDGETVTIAAHAIPVGLTLDLSGQLHVLSLPEYPGAETFPTSCANTKCDTDRGGNAVSRIVIHDTEGGWDASVSTLQNGAGKSVHYIVGDDGRVGQFVPESYTAYHAGNYYYNQRTVGIEHVGYFDQPYPAVQYAASAKLVNYLTAKYTVTVDRAHIIGHDQVPDGDVISESSAPCSSSPKTCETGTSYGGASNHRDPGDWEWATYMLRIGGVAKCNDVTSIFNCSADKTQAYACVGGDVVVKTCKDPCVIEANGVDDLCVEAPPVSDAGPPPTTDAGNVPADDGGLVAPQPGDGNGGVHAQADASVGDDSGGCDAGGTKGGSSSAWIVLAALALVKRRKKERGS